MNHRKIEQIYPTSLGLYALCTDGTVWGYEPDNYRWAPYPLVPSGDPLTAMNPDTH